MVRSSGQVIAGAVVSTTLMIWSQVVLLPQLSTAVQVRVITSSCGHVPSTELSLKLIAGSSSQLSVAVALPVSAGLVLCSAGTRAVMQLMSVLDSTSCVHCTVISSGQVIAGALVSMIVTI